MLARELKSYFQRELFAKPAVTGVVVEMVVSTGALQGKRLSSEGPDTETLPVLSGSFIAGWLSAGFFLPNGHATTLIVWAMDATYESACPSA